MTKSQLIDEIYQQSSGLTKAHLTSITETVFDAIKNSLVKGDKVEIRGFGNFILRKRDSRKARNPKTGVIVDVPPKSVPFLKAGKELKEMVNS